MTTLSKPIPKEIFLHINKYFKGAFLSEITLERDADNHLYYNLNATLEDVKYHLKFNSYGNLIQSEIEPLFELSDEGFDISDH